MMKNSCVILTLVLVAAASHAFADEKADKLLAEIQGQWTRNRQQNGVTLRLVKDIKGKKETFTAYREGQAVYSHTVEFEVEVTDHVNIFTFRNQTITLGPNAGNTTAGPFSYLFKVKDDTWYEVHGIVHQDQRVPALGSYKRVKAERDE